MAHPPYLHTRTQGASVGWRALLACMRRYHDKMMMVEMMGCDYIEIRVQAAFGHYYCTPSQDKQRHLANAVSANIRFPTPSLSPSLTPP
jgi:hypothetical protein